jgi:hypothetical protein
MLNLEGVAMETAFKLGMKKVRPIFGRPQNKLMKNILITSVKVPGVTVGQTLARFKK